MSDFTGLAGVTRTLMRLLTDRMRDAVTVTASPPDTTPPNVAGARVNLFLHRVVPNAVLRNQDLPGAGTPMGYGRPPLSLDMHYLLHAEPSEPSDDAAAHRALGDAMLVLHEVPIITPGLLRSAAPGDPVLDASLLDEVEHLRISHAPLSTEDLTNLWSATSAPYRLSATYTVTVVQLESTLPRRIAKPVLEPPDAGPRVAAVPINRPRLSTIGVVRAGGADEQPIPYARIGDTLILRGSGFLAGSRVRLGPVDATAGIVAAEASPSLLPVAVPDDPLLQPGAQPVSVVRDVEVGDPPTAVPAMGSNVLPIVVIPHLDSVTPAQGPPGTTATLQGTRLFSPDTPTYVLVGDRAIRVAAGPGATPTSVQVDIDGLPAGTFPVSIRVGGAESIDPLVFEVT